MIDNKKTRGKGVGIDFSKWLWSVKLLLAHVSATSGHPFWRKSSIIR